MNKQHNKTISIRKSQNKKNNLRSWIKQSKNNIHKSQWNKVTLKNLKWTINNHESDDKTTDTHISLSLNKN